MAITKKELENFSAYVDRFASKLADANYVEEAWFLRGLIDAMAGEKDPPGPEYNLYYKRGWSAGFLNLPSLEGR